MKKLIGYSLAAFVLIAGNAAHAATKSPEGSVAGGFEASGVVDVLAGYTHSDKDAGATLNFGSAIGEMNGNNGGANADIFGFYIDQVELDLSKTFGENIRFRADLDFQDNQGSGAVFPEANNSVFNLEQAYVTANIPTGSGSELLVGKFNAPIGFDTVDRNDLNTVSHANAFIFLTPANLIGAKVSHSFSDLVDLQVYVVNDLNNTVLSVARVRVDSAIPSVGGRLGFTWGEEGKQSTFGISGAAGPEQPGDVGCCGENAHWDFLGDVDFNLKLTDALSIGGEGVYRQSDLTTADRTTDTKNYKALGGQLVLHYAFSDVWGGTFRYDYLYDIDPHASDTSGRFTATDEQIHGLTLATDYAITDGAKFKLEYKFEYADPAGANNSDYHSLVGEWAYNF